MARQGSQGQAPDPAGAPRRLQHYLAGRCALLAAVIVLAAAVSVKSGDFPLAPQWFFGLNAAAFGWTLASAALLRARRSPVLLSKLQPLWDVLYTTGLVYLSGGALSPMSALYPLAIIGGAMLLSRSGALALSGACSVAYGLLVDLQYYRLIQPPNALISGTWGDDLPVHLVFTIAGFLAVGGLTGLLADELRKTGRRLAEVQAEFLDLEHLKDSILSSMPSGLVALDPRGREVFHNRAAQELLARAGVRLQPDMQLQGIFDLKEGDRKEAVLEGGSTVLGYTVSPLFDRERTPGGSILIFQDLTQVKHLEGDLRRADRLAAVGRLAAGLAHEIRNPLASLSGSVEVLAQNLQPSEEDRQLFDIVLRETARLNRLVTNFLHYARPDRADRSEVGLRAFVEEVAFFFLQGEGRERFALENRIPAETTLSADSGQLEQLLLNLFRNSLEAAQGRVHVTVEAVSDRSWLHLTVRDDGPGLPGESVARAFEPFYSTKEGGTGLGLATVHRIVENHRGHVRLESEAGMGAAFHFRFPVAGHELH